MYREVKDSSIVCDSLNPFILPKLYDMSQILEFLEESRVSLERAASSNTEHLCRQGVCLLDVSVRSSLRKHSRLPPIRKDGDSRPYENSLPFVNTRDSRPYANSREERQIEDKVARLTEKGTPEGPHRS